MADLGKEIGRSKGFSLDLLRTRLGKQNLTDRDCEQVIKFGTARADDGTGPVTVGIDIGYIRTLLVHDTAVRWVPYSMEPVDLGRVAPLRPSLVGKGNKRDQRPADEEIEALLNSFEHNNHQIIKAGIRALRRARPADLAAQRQCSRHNLSYSPSARSERSATPDVNLRAP